METRARYQHRIPGIALAFVILFLTIGITKYAYPGLLSKDVEGDCV